ncbi:MAG: hypothetical protein VXY77_04635 [Pseudomonadota bacterium]|nr:hypothetical protein [Pseudomonadota bacterium]
MVKLSTIQAGLLQSQQFEKGNQSDAARACTLVTNMWDLTQSLDSSFTEHLTAAANHYGISKDFLDLRRMVSLLTIVAKTAEQKDITRETQIGNLFSESSIANDYVRPGQEQRADFNKLAHAIAFSEEPSLKHLMGSNPSAVIGLTHVNQVFKATMAVLEAAKHPEESAERRTCLSKALDYLPKSEMTAERKACVKDHLAFMANQLATVNMLDLDYSRDNILAELNTHQRIPINEYASKNPMPAYRSFVTRVVASIRESFIARMMASGKAKLGDLLNDIKSRLGYKQSDDQTTGDQKDVKQGQASNENLDQTKNDDVKTGFVSKIVSRVSSMARSSLDSLRDNVVTRLLSSAMTQVKSLSTSMMQRLGLTGANDHVVAMDAKPEVSTNLRGQATVAKQGKSEETEQTKVAVPAQQAVSASA